MVSMEETQTHHKAVGSLNKNKRSRQEKSRQEPSVGHSLNTVSVSYGVDDDNDNVLPANLHQYFSHQGICPYDDMVGI